MTIWDDPELTDTERVKLGLAYYTELLQKRYRDQTDDELAVNLEKALAKDQHSIASLIEAEQQTRKLKHG